MFFVRGWRAWVLLCVVGICYLVALMFGLASQGGRESALFYRPFGFVATFPILILIGTLAAAGLNRLATLRNSFRSAIIVAPAILLSAVLAYETHLDQNPMRTFEQHIVSPAPSSLRVASAYTYRGFNYQNWAFHFFVAPVDLPMILAMRQFRHETDPAGFSLEQIRDNGRQRSGYPIPPLDFKAIHRYQFHRPNGRLGYTLTLYGDDTQTEFFAYGFAE